MMTSFTSFLEPLGKAEGPYISLLVFVCPILSLFTGKILNWSLWNLIYFSVLLTQKQTNQTWSGFPDFARRGTDIVFWFSFIVLLRKSYLIHINIVFHDTKQISKVLYFKASSILNFIIDKVVFCSKSTTNGSGRFLREHETDYLQKLYLWNR